MLNKGLTLPSILLVLLVTGCGLAMNDEDRLDRAEQAIADNDYRAAIIDAKDVLRKDPDNIRGRILLGRASIQVSDALSAEKEFRRALELGAEFSTVAVDLGRSMVRLGQFSEVIEEIDPDLASTDEELRKILQVRGDAHLGMRQSELARDVFTEILSTDNADVNAQLGIVTSYLIERNYTQARATLDQVLTTSENAVEPWLMSGQMYFDRRNAQGAGNHFDKALSLAVSQGDVAMETRALAGLSEAQLA